MNIKKIKKTLQEYFSKRCEDLLSEEDKEINIENLKKLLQKRFNEGFKYISHDHECECVIFSTKESLSAPNVKTRKVRSRYIEDEYNLITELLLFSDQPLKIESVLGWSLYTIPVEWTQLEQVHVVAESKNDAIKMVEDNVKNTILEDHIVLCRGRSFMDMTNTKVKVHDI